MDLETLFRSRYLPHIQRVLKPATVREYKRLAEVILLPKLGTRELETFTLEDAETLHANTPGKVQANRAVSLLSGMLTYAVERKILPYNACRGVYRNPERGRECFYTPAQTKAILAAASAWGDIRGRYIRLELLTGCRPGELLDSTPAWRYGGALRTPDGKTGGRIIYLPPAAEAILDGLPARESTDRYFPEGMDLRRAWDRIVRTAGVPRYRLYDLRHTFASAALAAGESLDVIGLMLGHRKRQTTLRYAHLAPDVGINAATAAAARMGVV